MFGFIRYWLEQRQHKSLNLWQVLYSPPNAHYWLSTFVIARTSYEACREFDTDPYYSGCRRHGKPTPQIT